MDAVLVLLLLAVIWAVVLVPPWIQARREALPAASIRSFHHQLWSLGQASPGHLAVPVGGHVRPFRRVGAAAGGGRWPDTGVYDHEGGGYGDDPVLGDDVYGDDPVLDDAYTTSYDDAFDDDSWDDADDDDPIDGGVRADERWVARTSGRADAGRGVPAAVAYRRLEGYQRRRRVLATLLVAAAATAVPAVVLGGIGWTVASVATSTLVVAYISLLVRRQRLTVERAEKVRYLAPIVAPRPAVVVLHGGAAR